MIIEESYTFDDVLLQPAYSKIGPADANVGTFISKNIKLNIPLISAAMDTVTEHRLAITMAQLGGMGVLHKNFSIKSLNKNGVFLAKCFKGGTEKEALDWMQKNFSKVHHVKPDASRKESVEGYVIALGFKGK